MVFAEEAHGHADSWSNQFRKSVADIPNLKDCHYNQSADRLRRMLTDGLFKLTDLNHHPDRFFAAHRILSEHATEVGPGFGIRMTVQYNLFAGTILALGNPAQVAELETYQAQGRLGCFALTEKLAGVNSGLVVNTTATWDSATQTYVIHCPGEHAHKNWISQGFTAEMAVCIADLIVDGVSFGPHGFLMQLRDPYTGELLPGVNVGNMGNKTIGNDLDNAWIKFHRVRLPKTALLNRYSDIDEHGEYKQLVDGVRNIDMIGQRLYTGRAVIAYSTLVFTRTLYSKTREYSDNKMCWTPEGDRPLSTIPQLYALYAEANTSLDRLFTLMNKIETALSAHLKSNMQLTPSSLVDAISVAKIKCIETSIDLCFRLKQEIGSYALMEGTGFSNLDYLQCCKFAEGDSRILMQKISRDRLAAYLRTLKKESGGSNFAKGQTNVNDMNYKQKEDQLCRYINLAVTNHGFKGWNDRWQEVYKLADVVIDHTLSSWVDMNTNHMVQPRSHL